MDKYYLFSYNMYTYIKEEQDILAKVYFHTKKDVLHAV